MKKLNKNESLTTRFFDEQNRLIEERTVTPEKSI